MNKIVTVISIAFLTLSTGCSRNSVYGPQRPFQAGSMGHTKICPAPKPDKDNFLRDRFVNAACASAADAGNNTKAVEMLNASFSLSQAGCTDFFAQKAGTQLTVETARSAVGPVLALLTGVLSIVNIKGDMDGSKRSDWEKGLALASSATLAGLSIVDQNFLFSAENIDDVRELTLHAMEQYRLTVLTLNNHSFDTSVTYTLQHHMICTPGKIKSLVKQAIKDKKISVVDRGSGNAVAPGANSDAGKSLEVE